MIEYAEGLSDEDKKLVEEMRASFRESDRLLKEGKLKPVSKHFQAKMDSGGPFADEIHDAPPAKPKPGKKG